MRNPLVAARIFNTPLLIHPGKLDAIIAGLAPRFGLTAGALAAPMLYDALPGEKRKPGYRVRDSIAVLDIFGILTHRGSIEADSSYLLGYQDIGRSLAVAVRDTGVRGIVLNIDSPGGEVDGAFQLAEQISQADAIKPVRAVIDGAGMSAAYLLAAAARDITATATSQVGSVGVVMRHVDWSEALAKEGVKISLIFAGAHKIDGNALEPLPPAVRGEMQALVDVIYDGFVGAVSGYRRLSAASVRATEARTYLAADGQAAGLVDAIGTVESVVDAMTTRNPIPPVYQASGAEERIFSVADMERARAEGLAGVQRDVKYEQAEFARARKEALLEERARIKAICEHPAALRNFELMEFLVAAGTPVAEAHKILQAVSKHPAAPGPALMMCGNVKVGPDGWTGDGGDIDEFAAGVRAVSLLAKNWRR